MNKKQVVKILKSGWNITDLRILIKESKRIEKMLVRKYKVDSKTKKLNSYLCTKCNRVHKNKSSKIYQDHIIYSKLITEYELRRIQFKKTWDLAKREQSTNGCVNLPKPKRRYN